jgi:hypothetical protein
VTAPVRSRQKDQRKASVKSGPKSVPPVSDTTFRGNLPLPRLSRKMKRHQFAQIAALLSNAPSVASLIKSGPLAGWRRTC